MKHLGVGIRIMLVVVFVAVVIWIVSGWAIGGPIAAMCPPHGPIATKVPVGMPCLGK